MKKLKTLIVLVAAALVSGFALAADPLGSWLSGLRQPDRSWQTGKLAKIADGYKGRFTANPSDYEARVFHAATILVQLGENKNVATYAKKFGFTLDYLGMKAKGTSSAPSSWAQPNAMADTFVKEGVPVLKEALADLEAIPTDWAGSVHLSSDDFPVDDDVDLDIGDILYARAGIEATIGLAYFAHGYDLTVDYAKGKKAVESRRTIQALPRVPDSEWDEMWEGVPDGAECEGGLSSFKIGYVGKKLYMRAEGEMEEVIKDGDHAIRSIYLELEDSSEEPVWSFLLTDDPDGHMQQDDHYTARVFNASEMKTWWYWDFSTKTVPVRVTQSEGACQFEIDLSKFANYAKAGTWTISWGEVCLYTEWNGYEHPYYDDYFERWYTGWWDCDWSNLGSLNDTPLTLYKFFTEQTKFMAKVRNQSSLPMSKSWMKTALNRALLADEVVQNRADGTMHFVEYDPADADALARARNLTEKALASLDAPQGVDVQNEILGDRESTFDLSLLPVDGEGVLRVYLGALFDGTITRDLLPTFNQGADEGPMPVIETIKDPTFGGLLPDFTARDWTHVIQGNGIDVAHQTVVVKLDGNGGQVKPNTLSLDYDAEIEACCYPELPMPAARKGYVFVGWRTAKAAGAWVHFGDEYDASLFAGAKTPTLYAQWLQLKKLTLKDESAFASWFLDPDENEEILDELAIANPEYEVGGELEGKGVLEVLPGAMVNVGVTEPTIVDKSGNELTFQRWTVSPSKANMGALFHATYSDTQFVMPNEDVTLQASYIDALTCGSLYVTALYEKVNLGYDYLTGDNAYLTPPSGAFEWSVDGGKNWYKATMADNDYESYFEGDYPMLKAGNYTLTWRSTDPQWTVPTCKTKVVVPAGDYSEFTAYPYDFTYIPQVVVDVMTYENGELTDSPVGGTFTLNPKDGLVPIGKSVTFTAKAAKGYAFQGWTFSRYWEYGYRFQETAATWKFENYKTYYSSWYGDSILTQYINPADRKVHVVAVFKALADYSPDDIAFSGFEGYDTYNEVGDGGSVTIKAVVGCALDDNLKLVCAPSASPLTYKVEGKLPDGVKFDAKTGVLSGAPKKVGNTSVTIKATDPANNAKSITVDFEVSPLPPWLAGEFRGSIVGYNGDPQQQEGILELSVKSDGKASAKVITRIGARSVSGSLTWRDRDTFVGYDEGEFAEFCFWHTDAKDDSYCHVKFYEGGAIAGVVDSYDKTEDDYVGGNMTGMRQNTALLDDCPFLEKYYTFAFSAETEKDEEMMTSGYGYLTIKTDKKGGAKVTGQLPDGEKVSMSALVMPFFADETLKARLYLFASPSAYKKLDWFAMTLTIDQDGEIWSEDAGAAWTPADLVVDEAGMVNYVNAQVSGVGALYSEAKSLEAHYWMVSCAWSDKVQQQNPYKYMEENEDNPSKPYSWTKYDYYASAMDFGGFLFNVKVKGDNKGSISLDKKSPAPWEESWKEEGVTYKEWNYWYDKKDNEITDPSQLSFSFAKATGIFTGKATVYFDYELPNCKQNSKTKEIEWSYTMKHTTATLPYAGVMIADGEGGYSGLGAAAYTYKYSYEDEKGKTKSETKTVSLPVSLDSE